MQDKSISTVKAGRVSADILTSFMVLHWLQTSRKMEGVKQKPKEDKAPFTTCSLNQ